MKVIKVLLSTNLMLSSFNLKMTEFLSIHINQKEDIQWVYKNEDGMIYRRKFNYTNDSWIGKWELCLSSFTDEEIGEAEKYAEEFISTMKADGVTEDTIILKCGGGLLWNTETDIREQYPGERSQVMTLNDVWNWKKEKYLKSLVKKSHKDIKQDASETEESTVEDYTAYPVNTILNQYSYDISMYSSEKIADATAHAEEYVQSNIERDGDSGIYLLSPDGVGFFSNCTITDVREDAELIDGICQGEEPHFVDLDGMKQIVIYWNLNDIHE